MAAAENRKPSGSGTAWAATSLAASRYLPSRAGDITSASPVLVNPSPAAPSWGNSRRVERDAGEVADRPGVLDVAEPSHDDPARVAGALVCLEVEVAADPSAQQPAILGLRLPGLRRRHLPLVEHIGHLPPGRYAATGLGQRGEPLQVDVRLRLLAGVAFGAEAIEQRADLLPQLPVEPAAAIAVASGAALSSAASAGEAGRAQGQQPRHHDDGLATAAAQGRPPPGVRSPMMHLGEVPLRGKLGGRDSVRLV